MMRAGKFQFKDISCEEVEELRQGLLTRTLSDNDNQMIENILSCYVKLLALLEQKNISMGRLKRMLFGEKTEKTKNVKQMLKDAKDKARGRNSKNNKGEKKKGKPSKKGHGRNGAAAYKGAEIVKVLHQSHRPGCKCPLCHKGKLYPIPPGEWVRITGQPPLKATRYELEKLRCNSCGESFTAKPPEGVGEKKYDANSMAIMALLKYGNGFPFYRLQTFQSGLEVPLPASTQWEIVEKAADIFEPIILHLICMAAQGSVFYNDDTKAKVLSLMKKLNKNEKLLNKAPPERKGIFTSAVISEVQDYKIALYFTGKKHAGETLAEVLTKRKKNIKTPIQMCDALTRNAPKPFKVILANCMAHGRRQFYDVVRQFPQECVHVFEKLALVYRYDEETKILGYSENQRLQYHKRKSMPVMEKLYAWFEEKFENREVEPNSGLGNAINYMMDHWKKLTRFLHVPGAPLDNNICERALKKAILNRKNSYFYKTENGARVGDLFMTVIHTASLCSANLFDYLIQVLSREQEVRENPQNWLPWNYRENLVKAS